MPRRAKQKLPPGTMDVKIVTHLVLKDNEDLDAVMRQMRRVLRVHLPMIARRMRGTWLATLGDITLDRRRVAGWKK